MTLLPPSYACATGSGRLPYTFVCDHRQDCGDNSDESFCFFSSCQKRMALQCGNTEQCYASAQGCDGQVDCINEEDEARCSFLNEVGETHKRLPPPPSVIDFVKNGSTIITPLPSVQQGQLPPLHVCPDTHYQCAHNGYCLPIFTRCNGFNDCPDHEDEAGCDSYTCPSHHRCFDSRVCVHPRQVCDGIYHCPRSEDELLCHQHCPQHCTCHGFAFTCLQSFSTDHYPDLRYLNVRGSGMTTSELPANEMLVYLSLANCHLTNISTAAFPNLLTLDLSNNRLVSIPVAILMSSQNLKVLFLSKNVLTGVLAATKPQTFLQVKTLDLSMIPLYTLDIITRFPEVTMLNLSYTSAQQEIGNSLQQMKKLCILDLRGYTMTAIHKDLLLGLDQLHTVYADHYKACCAALVLSEFNTCEAPQNELSSCEDLLRSNVYRISLAVFSSLALVGNGVSFVFRLSSLQGSGSPGFNVFVLHLCVSDFLMGLYLTLVGVADRLYEGIYVWEDATWRHSVPCKMAGFLSLVSCEVSSFLICLITLDRFLVVRFPLSFLHFKGWNAQLASCLSWMVGFVLALVPLLPALAYWEFYSQTGICIPLPVTRKRFAGHHYSFGIVIILNFFLFLVISLGQAVIYYSIRFNTLTEGASSQRSKDASIARRLFTVVMSDFLCWFPIGSLGLLASHGQPVSGGVNVAMSIIVMPVNSVLNPFLYTLNLILEKRQRMKEERLFTLMKTH